MSDVDSTPARAAGRAPQQPDLEGVDTNTRPMWAIACLPLVGLVIQVIPGSFIGTGVRPGVTATGTVWDVVSTVLSLGLVLVEVLLAVADRRILIGRGVIRPLHPAWALLDPVYVIGRTVVVRRRVRGSLNPLWVWVGTSVVAAVVGSLLG